MAIKIVNKATIVSAQKTAANIDIKKFTSILKGKQELYSARSRSKEYEKQLSSIATKLNNAVRKEIASSFGGTLLSSKAKTGFRPSYSAVIDDRVETGKIKEVETKVVNDRLVVKRGIQLAGSSGIAINRGRQTFLTGLQVKDGKTEEQITEVSTTRLFNRLAEAKDSNEIKRILSTKGEANTALRDNIELNTQAINLISTINGKVENRQIRFSWADIKKNPGIVVSVKKQSDESISLQVSFSAALLTSTVNDANKVVVKSLEREVSQTLLQAASDIITYPTSNNVLELRKLLFSQSSKYSIQYLSDPQIISNGTFSRQERRKEQRKKKKDTQRLLSDAQFSALVRSATEKQMPIGRPGGPPLSPTRLTYRTGRFVESIRVQQDIKKSLVRFYYMPLYSVHESTRSPSELIERSIRQVAQLVYKRTLNGERDFSI